MSYINVSYTGKFPSESDTYVNMMNISSAVKPSVQTFQLPAVKMHNKASTSLNEADHGEHHAKSPPPTATKPK